MPQIHKLRQYDTSGNMFDVPKRIDLPKRVNLDLRDNPSLCEFIDETARSLHNSFAGAVRVLLDEAVAHRKAAAKSGGAK